MKRLLPAITLALALAGCIDQPATAPEMRPQAAAVPASGFGTTVDLEDVFGLPTANDISGLANGFLQQVVNTSDPDVLKRVFSRWLTTLIAARINQVNTDTEPFAALSDYYWWRFFAENYVADVPDSFQAEIDALSRSIADRLARAIDGNLTACRTNQRFWRVGQRPALVWPGRSSRSSGRELLDDDGHRPANRNCTTLPNGCRTVDPVP